MNCPKCGAEMPDGSKYCGVCGNQLNGPAMPPAQPETLNQPYVAPVVMPAAPEQKSNKTLFIIIGAIAGVFVLLLVLVGGYFLLKQYVLQKADNNLNKEAEKIGTTTTTGTSDYYTNTTEGFKIKGPKDWKVDSSGKNGAIVIITNTVADPVGTTSFTANLNVVKDSMYGKKIEDYYAATRDLLFDDFPNYATYDNNRYTTLNSGKTAYILGGTFTSNGITMKNVQFFVEDSGNVFVITATTTKDLWDKYQNTFFDSIMTFELL